MQVDSLLNELLVCGFGEEELWWWEDVRCNIKKATCAALDVFTTE